MEDNRKVLYDIVYEKMFTVMNNYHPVSESLRELIYDNSAPVRFTKGELLLTENRECNVLFLLLYSELPAPFLYQTGFYSRKMVGYFSILPA